MKLLIRHAISDADFGNIQLLDSKSSQLHIVAQHGFPKWWLDFWDEVQEGQGVCGTALEKGERVIVEDVEKSPIFMGILNLISSLRPMYMQFNLRLSLAGQESHSACFQHTLKNHTDQTNANYDY